MYVAFQLACVPSLGGLHRRTWLARRAGRLETPWPAPTGRTGVPDHLGCHRLHRARHFCRPPRSRGQPQHRPPTLAHARSRRPPGPTPIRQPLPDSRRLSVACRHRRAAPALAVLGHLRRRPTRALTPPLAHPSRRNHAARDATFFAMNIRYATLGTRATPSLCALTCDMPCSHLLRLAEKTAAHLRRSPAHRLARADQLDRVLARARGLQALQALQVHHPPQHRVRPSAGRCRWPVPDRRLV